MAANHIKVGLDVRLVVALAAAWTAVTGAAGGEVGSAACSVCHAGVARDYAATGMARSAGPANAAAALPARVGVYSLSGAGAGAIRLRLEPEGLERRLEWRIGSGHAGSSYLFSAGEGFLFQAPVSYYASLRSWALSPGFENLRAGQFTRAVEPACLRCHASRLRHREATVNQFAAPPFLEPGVSCEQCHGEGEAHVKNPQAASMVNPAQLAPDLRNSVCEQCHLTGAARIARAGGEPYRPGTRLSDSLAVFVWKEARATAGATGHAEGLAQSRCSERSAPGKLSCLSCHDPHREPPAARKAAFFRERCEQCHAPAASHCRKLGRTDCVSCHMPRRAAAATDHLAFTDHSIPRLPKPRGTAESRPATGELVSFWRGVAEPPASSRDLALAYSVAGARAKADSLLPQLDAGAEARVADPALAIELAQWHERQGRAGRARELYEQALSLDPAAAAASVNLGNLRMKAGDAEGAMRCWTDALARNPGFTAARVNLGLAQYRAGQREAAIATLRTALAFEPRHEAARKLLAEMGASGPGAR